MTFGHCSNIFFLVFETDLERDTLSSTKLLIRISICFQRLGPEMSLQFVGNQQIQGSLLFPFSARISSLRLLLTTFFTSTGDIVIILGLFVLASSSFSLLLDLWLRLTYSYFFKISSLFFSDSFSNSKVSMLRWLFSHSILLVCMSLIESYLFLEIYRFYFSWRLKLAISNSGSSNFSYFFKLSSFAGYSFMIVQNALVLVGLSRTFPTRFFMRGEERSPQKYSKYGQDGSLQIQFQKLTSARWRLQQSCPILQMGLLGSSNTKVFLPSKIPSSTLLPNRSLLYRTPKDVRLFLLCTPTEYSRQVSSKIIARPQSNPNRQYMLFSSRNFRKELSITMKSLRYFISKQGIGSDLKLHSLISYSKCQLQRISDLCNISQLPSQIVQTIIPVLYFQKTSKIFEFQESIPFQYSATISTSFILKMPMPSGEFCFQKPQ